MTGTYDWNAENLKTYIIVWIVGAIIEIICSATSNFIFASRNRKYLSKVAPGEYQAMQNRLK